MCVCEGLQLPVKAWSRNTPVHGVVSDLRAAGVRGEEWALTPADAPSFRQADAAVRSTS